MTRLAGSGMQEAAAIQRDRFEEDLNNPQTWYVCSAHPNATASLNGGGSANYPFATLAGALNNQRVKADRGDMILIGEYHREAVTTAGAITVDKAGLRIVGLGVGDSRPVFTVGGAPSADVQITADDCWLENLVFECNETGADLVRMLALLAADCDLVNIELREGSSTRQALRYLHLSAAANNARARNCLIRSLTAGSASGIGIAGACANALFEGCTVIGDFSDGAIYNPTANIATNLDINRAVVSNSASSGYGIRLVSACTGMIRHCDIVCDTHANAVVPGSCKTLANEWASTANVRGGPAPVAGGPIGSRFWVKKTLTSSAIVTGGVDITGVSAGGQLAIVDVVLKTDATGLATGTNLQITANNANGANLIMEEAVANLGASATVDLAGASVSKTHEILESGKKLIAKSTGASCTGAGTIDVWLCFERIDAGTTIAAA